MARRRSDALARGGTRTPAGGDGCCRRRSAPGRRPTRPRRPGVDRRCRQGHRGGGRCARRARAQRRDRRRRDRVEDMPFEVWEQLFRTNLFGPVRLTKALLPSMRAAGRGRIVVVSSQGGIRGMPSISAYSASKGALERWAEALAEEIAPFGLGVTILVSGTFKTDILTEQTPTTGTMNGPYAAHYAGIERTGGFDGAPGEPARTFRSGARQRSRRAGPVRPARGGHRRPHAAARQSPPAGPAPPSRDPSGDAPSASWRAPGPPASRPPRVAIDDSPSEESEQHG